MSNLRFLCISAVFPPAFCYGGVPHSVFGLVKNLISIGHDCLVITTNANGNQNFVVNPQSIITYENVPVLYTPRWRTNSFFYAPSLGNCLRKVALDFDIALVNGGWGFINLAARIHLPKLGLPYILYPKGLFDPWAFRHKYLKKLLYWHLVERWNYAKAAGISALTESEAAPARQCFPHVPVKVIPNGVNLYDFYPAPGKEDFNRLFPQLADQPYILFLSRLHPKKGLDLLFPAFRRLGEMFQEADSPKPYLVVAGEGEAKYKDELVRMTEQLGLGGRVLFAGLVTGQAKLALLHHCTFMVLPSRGEGLPMAVLEALACGKPVILTPECYLPEVARSEAGLEVDLGIEPLAAAMARVWIDGGMQQEMGEKAIQLVKAKFTWERVARETVRFCEQLLSNNGKKLKG